MTTPAARLPAQDTPPTVCLFVCGILTVPGAAGNWTGRAVTWTHLHTPHKAEKVEYYTGPVSRIAGDTRRATKLVRTLERYLAAGWRIILAGHSNGCDVILDALQMMAWPQIHALHLISAACEADFTRNGLNAAGRRIGHLSIYVAEKDWALVLADTLAGRWLGYGCLGKRGPLNATGRSAPDRVVRQPIGHGEWFSTARFDETLRMITSPFS